MDPEYTNIFEHDLVELVAKEATKSLGDSHSTKFPLHDLIISS